MGSKLLGLIGLMVLTACASQPQMYTYGGRPLTFEQRMQVEQLQQRQYESGMEQVRRNSESIGCSIGNICPKTRHEVSIFGN